MKNILVVDDDRNLALLYEQELSDEGYQVTVVNNAKDAIDRIDASPPDLVVLDIRMPGMDGIEAMGRILARDNQMPVILNSAYTSYKDNFMSWSADAYVVKSSDLTELKEEIRKALDKRDRA
jgi:DNA-binding response OmpR family regulator